MEILISRTIQGLGFKSPPNPHPHILTVALVLITMLSTYHTVDAEPPPQLQHRQQQQRNHQQDHQQRLQQDLTGFLQLHPNGFPEVGNNNDEDDEDYNSYPSTGTQPETRDGFDDDALGGPKVDAHGSWLSFVRHSSKPSDKKCERDKNKKSSRTLLEPENTPQVAGPPGPQGPPGPPGPPGAEVTKEQLFEEFRELITEAAERRAQILVQERCPSCLSNSTQAWLPDISDMQILPHLPIAFHCKLLKGVEVHKKSLVEVANFQTPFADGAFKRGEGLDVKSGRFTAPRTAIYQFSTSLHINHPVSKKRSKELKYRDHLRVLICIDSLCFRHTSLEFISGMESNSRIFTVTVLGLLRLQAGQYASVYVDNSSSRTVLIQDGSDFTGLLMGL